MAVVTKFFDKEFEQKEFSELAVAPIDAIAGKKARIYGI